MRMIDADALLEHIWDADTRVGYVQVVDRQDIEDAPTIEERKKGKWEEREVSSEKVIDEWQSARCSVCGKYHTTPYMYFFHDYNYCPNCGADMRGENDGK